MWICCSAPWRNSTKGSGLEDIEAIV